MEAERYPASSETDTLHSLAKLVAAYLRDGDGEPLPSKKVLYKGHAVAAVAATSVHTAEEALRPHSG